MTTADGDDEEEGWPSLGSRSDGAAASSSIIDLASTGTGCEITCSSLVAAEFAEGDVAAAVAAAAAEGGEEAAEEVGGASLVVAAACMLVRSSDGCVYPSKFSVCIRLTPLSPTRALTRSTSAKCLYPSVKSGEGRRWSCTRPQCTARGGTQASPPVQERSHSRAGPRKSLWSVASPMPSESVFLVALQLRRP